MEKMEKMEKNESVSIIKNYIAPLTLMIILPILLILLLQKYATASSKNIYPNTFSLGVLIVLLLWAMIWGKKAEYIADESGKLKLLTSGWWGVSRHINYVFEIGLSACWCGVALKFPPLAYLAYIIILLVHRTFSLYMT